MSSNCILINDYEIELPEGVKGEHYLNDDALPHFKSKPRRKTLKHFVLHETAGNSATGCMRTLKKKGYGVQLILDRSGFITCHGDLATEVMIHANQLNKTSAGIEVVNPYAPKLAAYPVDTIPAEWWCWCPDKKDRRYVLPTSAQIDTLQILVPWLCEQLKIPYVFPTWFLNRKHRKLKRPAAGVVAHRDFAKHADGRYLLQWLMTMYTRQNQLLDAADGISIVKDFSDFFTREQS